MKYRTVIGIDPGRTAGWSRFFDGHLAEAGRMPSEVILTQPPEANIGPAAVVIELPQVYPHHSRGDLNQLIDLAVLVGDLQGFYRRNGCDAILVTPVRWKGSVPKPIHNVRVLEALTDEERDLLPKRPRGSGFDHNMIDAVGLGLWLLRKEGDR